ncbi:serine/threonine protein kinase [Streptomyces sp. NPDC002133]|uniref:serine/threonine protein kinase n=1 Tax=Streptomyces sp. NPDC002133 TaxID=3154409 RepID=UPI003326B750
MDDYAGRVLADRYRLPLPPSDEYELVETRAFDTYSGQEVVVRQVPLPEVVDAEVLDPDGGSGPRGSSVQRRAPGRTTRRPTDPAVRRAVEAAQAAARIPDHPRLDQVFDVFAEGGSLWIVSELIAARPLAALLAEKPLNPYRAAEIGSDVLTALRALHAHGWTHRNITVRTVLVCDDGRVVLTGLAAGAAEEALCGYAPVPEPLDQVIEADLVDPVGPPPGGAAPTPDPAPGLAPVPGPAPVPRPGGATDPYAPPAYGYGFGEDSGDRRATRAGAIAAYRAGARAAARVTEDRRQDEARRELESGRRAEDHGGHAQHGEHGRQSQDGHHGVERLHHPGVRDEPAGGRGSGSALPAPRSGAPEPQWWSRPTDTDDDDIHDDIDDMDDDVYEVDAFEVETYESDATDDATYDVATYDDVTYGEDPPRSPYRPRRAELAGTWHDGPRPGADGPTPIPAGGGPSPYGRGSFGTDALRADAQRQQLPAQARGAGRPGTGGTGNSASTGSTGSTGSTVGTGRWDDVVAGGPATPLAPYRGPATPLAAERARQARIAVVGAVTERWAPEQAGPVHENWQLAPPIGPATDLWALGALLYRAVQGHAPYPEESAVELVQLVCAEPPAFAEECGPLRPVVESLLRQDPTERPDFEELRGWLRSLIRSAPEPDAGAEVVPLPSVDGTRLPVVRRRGELVRKRRAGSPAATHGRHRHKKVKEPRERRERRPRGPRSLGRLLLVLILLALAAAVAYAVMFMPKADPQSAGSTAPGAGAPANSESPDGGGTPGPQQPSGAPDGQQPQTSAPAVDLADGYVVRVDPEGFRIGVDKTWQRRPINDSGQVRYVGGDFTLIVVPGRDSVRANGADPMAYQRNKERELQPFRESSWSSASGLRRIDVGKQAMAEGQFTWQDSTGREVYVRNIAMIVGDRYHVIQVIGPEGQRDKVSEIYQQATAAYRAAG